MEQFFNQHDYMSKFDIKKAIIILIFISCLIFKLIFLVFHGRLGKTCYFVFTVLPFGLTSAPFIFTKVMRYLVKHWRINEFVKKSLQNAGFIINEEKSVENTTKFDLVRNKNKL